MRINSATKSMKIGIHWVNDNNLRMWVKTIFPHSLIFTHLTTSLYAYMYIKYIVFFKPIHRRQIHSPLILVRSWSRFLQIQRFSHVYLNVRIKEHLFNTFELKALLSLPFLTKHFALMNSLQLLFHSCNLFGRIAKLENSTGFDTYTVSSCIQLTWCF